MSASVSELVERLVERFEREGLRVVRRGFLEGFSGLSHFFDLIIEDPQSGKKIAISLIDKLGFEHVISILGTRLDTRTPHVVFASTIEPGVERILRGSNVMIISLGRVAIASSVPEGLEEKVLGDVLKILGGIG